MNNFHSEQRNLNNNRAESVKSRGWKLRLEFEMSFSTTNANFMHKNAVFSWIYLFYWTSWVAVEKAVVWRRQWPVAFQTRFRLSKNRFQLAVKVFWTTRVFSNSSWLNKLAQLDSNWPQQNKTSEILIHKYLITENFLFIFSCFLWNVCKSLKFVFQT